MFKAMGHKEVYVLDGGLTLWQENNFDTTSTYFQPNVKGNFIADFQSNWFADTQVMLNAINDESKMIIYEEIAKNDQKIFLPNQRKENSELILILHL